MSGPPPDPAHAPRAHRVRALRGPRGMSWVTLLLLLAVGCGAYLAWVWVPVYAEHYAVRQVVRDHMNQAVKNRDDEALRRDMVAKIRSIAEVERLDEDGRPVLLPAVVLDEGAVVWNRDARSQPPMLRVSFEYTREVALPVIDRTASKVFSVDESNELKVPDWGPAR